MLSFSSKQLYTGNPPFTLKPSFADKAAGCARQMVAMIIAILLSSCVACGVAAVFLDNKNPAVFGGVCFGTFVVLFLITSWIAKSTYTKPFDGSVILDLNQFVVQRKNMAPMVHTYSAVTNVQIEKSKSEQLVFRFDMANGRFDLDRSLATFPDDHDIIASSVLPAVAMNWDQMILRDGRTIIVRSDFGKLGLTLGGYFWLVIGFSNIFSPYTWGSISKNVKRGFKMLKLAGFTGKPFEVGPHGIKTLNGPEQPTPYADLRVTKYDDIGLIIQGTMDGSEFRAPILATNSYVLGFWLQDRISKRYFENPNSIPPSGDSGFPHGTGPDDMGSREIGAADRQPHQDPPESGRRFGEGLDDLKSDLF